jgi:hypothetical protein
VPIASLAHEIAGAASWLQDRGVAGYTQAGDGLVNGSDDGRRSVEGVEGGALGAVVFRLAQERFQLLAQGLPTGILVTAGDRIGEDRQGDWPEAGEAAERLLFFWRGKPLFLLDFLDGADGGDYVAGFCFFTAGDGRGRQASWPGRRLRFIDKCRRVGRSCAGVKRAWGGRFRLGRRRVYRNGVKQCPFARRFQSGNV